MAVIKKVAKNTLFLASSQIISKLAGFFFLVIVARYLGVEDYGKYAFAFAFASLFSFMVNFGLTPLTIREVAQDKSRADRYLSNSLALKLVLFVATFLLMFITINIMRYPADTKLAVYIAGIVLLFDGIEGCFNSIFSAFQRMEFQAFLAVLRRGLLIAIGLFFISLGFGLVPLVTVSVFSAVISVLFAFGIVSMRFLKIRLGFDLKFWKYLFVSAFPFMIVTALSMIYLRIDTVMISMIKGDMPVGWYNAAYNFILGIASVPIAFVAALYPVMSGYAESSIEKMSDAYRRAFKYLAILSIPMAIGTTLLAGRFIHIAYGKEYAFATIALQILIWAEAFNFLNYLFGMVMRSTNSQVLLAKIVFGGALLNIALNSVLIPFYSYVGAAISTVASYFIVFLCSFIYISRHVTGVPLMSFLIRPVVAGLLMGVFVYNFFELNILLLVCLSAVIYFAVLFIIGGFSAVDFRSMKRIIGGE